MSLYDDRTDNFFVVNDRDGENVDLLLVSAEDEVDLTNTEDLPVVEAPSTTGIALLRYLAPTASSFKRADELRRSAVCDLR